MSPHMLPDSIPPIAPTHASFPAIPQALHQLFLMAFCAAALVLPMRRPSAASRSCCCSSLSGLAAAPERW